MNHWNRICNRLPGACLFTAFLGIAFLLESSRAQTLSPDRQAAFLSALRVSNSDFYAHVYDIEADRDGFIYVVGDTNSYDLPISANAYQRTNSGGGGCDRYGCGGAVGDGFIVKLDPSGSHVLAATYLGGPQADSIYAIAFDSAGNVLVSASTSLALPTTERAVYTSGGSYILKFDNSLSTLLLSTAWPFGPSSIAVDDQDRIIVTGYLTVEDWKNLGTHASQLGLNAHCPNRFCSYVARLNPAATEIEMAARFPAGIHASRLAADGGIWLAGYADPGEFAMSSYSRVRRTRRSVPEGQLYIAKLSVDLELSSAVEAMPELQDWQVPKRPLINEIYLTRDGTLYVTGYGKQGLPITSSAFQPKNAGGDDGFLSVVLPTGELKYSTWLGTERADVGWSVRVDRAGVAWLFGKSAVDESPEAPHCSRWIVAIDPEKSGDQSLISRYCTDVRITDENPYRYEEYGGILELKDGSFALAAFTGAPLPGDPESSFGLCVFRMAAKPLAEIAMSSTAPNAVRRGKLWPFEITLANNGEEAALNNILRMKVPDVFHTKGNEPIIVSVESSQGTCQYTKELVCDLGRIDAHTNALVRVFTFLNGAEWWFFQTQASWQDDAGKQYQNWSEHVIPRAYSTIADTGVTLTGFSPVILKGSTAKYTVNIRNKGPDTTDVQFGLNTWGGDFNEMQSSSKDHSCNSQPAGGGSAGSLLCTFRQMQPGTEAQLELAVTFKQAALTELAGGVNGDVTTFDANRDDNSFRFPLQVVDEIKPAVLKDWVLGKDFYDGSPELRISTPDWYLTSTAYWDGVPQTAKMMHMAFALHPPPADLHGKHEIKVCTPMVGCSNTLYVEFAGNARPLRTTRADGSRAARLLTSSPRALEDQGKK